MSHRLTVIGTGYLGATHAACMADLGFEVLGLDVDEEKIARLSAGDLPVYEPGLEPVLRRGLETGRLRFTTSYEEVAEFGDVHFLCVGTPQKAGEYAADLTYVDGAIASLAPLLERPSLVVGKSTVPVGTAARLGEALAKASPAGEDAVLAWNPEFLREGFAVQDTLHPDRIVIGLPPERGAAEHAEKVLREVYRTMIAEGTPFITADFPTAELVKVSANAFLATKISFINAMAEVCEAAHADVTKLSEALSYDDRIGGKFLGPGLGFGGGCLPKDIRAFMARAGELGADQALTFLREVDEINIRRRIRMVDLARQLLGGSFAGRTVGVLGAAFKPNSDDVRDSPALDVAASIRAQGARVTVYDPQAMRNARRAQPTLEYGESAMSAVQDAHAVLLLTEWAEFRDMDPATVAEAVAERNIVDGRNALDPELWRAAGWNYRALGRP
ncbi:UDP-glucose dehydrogenase family protein [Actinomadura citrea]|uniref:UDP-glucose 6-dehydrogenase n=1 Tax=Actinomadura citrea TaxID=46158 RepID=A0A7Y9KGW8_9ACTN|nr:UDP-glucose/GDP-mannose dehydrogenase family protein [Actinomadura citrea]NYE17095.1 UDPglucose 6-dehydrogenase [Actinomadura citrea]GGU08922.1 UDP-glucose 6-dehydrogenase [Actinomadura citrea]